MSSKTILLNGKAVSFNTLNELRHAASRLGVIIAADVLIGRGVIIERGVNLHSGTVISDGVHIGEMVVIGKNTFIGRNTFISKEVLIGNNVIVQNGLRLFIGTRIGSWVTILDRHYVDDWVPIHYSMTELFRLACDEVTTVCYSDGVYGCNIISVPLKIDKGKYTINLRSTHLARYLAKKKRIGYKDYYFKWN